MEKAIIELLSGISDEEKEAIANQRVNTSIYSSTKDSVIKIKSIIGDKKIGIKKHTRFVPFPYHKHDYLEIIYVCQGYMTHHLGDRIILLEEGNLLFINKNVYHSIETTSINDIGINILLSDDFVSFLVARLNDKSLITNFLTRSLKNDVTEEFLLYVVGDCIPVQNILSNLVYSLSGNHHDSPSIVPANFSLLVNYLTLYEETLKLSLLSKDKSEMLQIYIEDYINNNYRSASLKELAHLTHYSASYLCRYIKDKYQKNFLALLCEKRIEIAADLLIRSDLSIIDIINSIGYTNRYHFINIFKKKYHCLPSDYRKHNSSTI